jgi:hypothetical protein
MSQVTQAERMHRLIKMKDLVDEGITEPAQIAARLGCELNTVKRNMKFLDDLRVADLTAREIADKRQEIYLELMEASTKAKERFEEAIASEKSSLDIKRYFDAWLSALQMRAKLFGVIIDRPEQYVQINNIQNNNIDPSLEVSIPSDVRKKLTDAIKKSHEAKVLETYNG